MPMPLLLLMLHCHPPRPMFNSIVCVTATNMSYAVNTCFLFVQMQAASSSARLAGQGPPSVGEWWLMSVDDPWDPTNRTEDEEYYAEVISYEMIGNGTVPVYTVQDVGEVEGNEKNNPLTRCFFVYVFS